MKKLDNYKLTQKKFLKIIACPICKKSLIKKNNKLYCKTCKNQYKINGNIPQLITKESLDGLKEELDAQKQAMEEQEFMESNPTILKLKKNWQKGIIVNEDGLVLDIGCGNARLSELMKNKNIIGLDPSNDFLKEANKRLKFLVRGAIEELPFRDNSFDIIYLSNILHHLKNPKKGLDEVARVLKPNGRMAAHETKKSFFNIIPRKIYYFFSKSITKQHKNFEFEELKNLIENKFYIEEIKYTGYLGYTYELIEIFIRCNKTIMDILLWMDEKIISRLPWIKTQSWHVIIKTTKKGK